MKCRLVIFVTLTCWAALVRVSFAQEANAQPEPVSLAVQMAARPPADVFGPDRELRRERDFGAITLSAFGSGPALNAHPPLEQAGRFGPVTFSISPTAKAYESDLGRFEETGAEVRLGQQLRNSIGVFTLPERPTWYIFAGGGGQAITYTPGARAFDTPGGSIRLQDRVRVGRMQAGLAIQQGGWQASLAYVRREVNIGDQYSRQQHFAGFSLSFKR